MVIDVTVAMAATIKVSPGTMIEMIGKPGDYRVVRQVVENRNHVYIVTTNGTWHPVSAYGKTWRLSK